MPAHEVVAPQDRDGQGEDCALGAKGSCVDQNATYSRPDWTKQTVKCDDQVYNCGRQDHGEQKDVLDTETLGQYQVKTTCQPQICKQSRALVAARMLWATGHSCARNPRWWLSCAGAGLARMFR